VGHVGHLTRITPLERVSVEIVAKEVVE